MNSKEVEQARPALAKLMVASFLSSILLASLIAVVSFLLYFKFFIPKTVKGLIEAKTLSEKLQNYRDFLSSFTNGWLLFLAILVLVGVAIYLWRKSISTFDEAIQKVRSIQVESLLKKAELGELEELPPSQLMNEIEEAAIENAQQIESIENVLLSEEGHELKEEAEPVLAELKARGVQLQEAYSISDLERRIDNQLDETDRELPPPQGWFQRIATVFISRGLVTGLSKASRIIILLLVAFIALGFLKISSSGVKKISGNRLHNNQMLLVQLTKEEKQRKIEFGIELAQQDVDSDYAEIEQLPDIDDNADPEATALANEMAALFETQLIADHIDEDSLSKAAAVAVAVKSETSKSVREKILNSYARKKSTIEVIKPELDETAQKAQKARAKTAKIVKSAKSRAKTPQTAQGKAMAKDLKKAINKGGAKMKTRFKYSLIKLQKSVKPSEIGTIIGRGLSGQKGRPLANAPPKSKNAVTYLRKDITRKLVKSDSPEAVIKNVSSKNLNKFTTDKEFRKLTKELNKSGDIKNRLPSISKKRIPETPSLSSKSTVKVNQQKAKRSMTRMFARAGGSDSSRYLVESSRKYENYFPTSTKTGTSGLYGNVRKDLAKSSYVNDNKHLKVSQRTSLRAVKPIKPQSVSRMSKSRSRSFRSLRAFSRIGGVLIGQLPKDVGYKLSDIKLQINGNQCKIISLLEDGTKITSKSYPVSMVYQALVYAADERPVAVTMVTADPLKELKILVHPALEDTILGEQMIELDRYVDQFARKNVTRDAESNVFYANQLYKLARAVRIQEKLSAKALSRYSGEDATFLKNIRDAADKEILKLSENELLLTFIKDPKINLFEMSPLSKKDFYDRKLVSVLNQFFNSNKERNMKSLISFLILNSAYTDDIKRIITPAPKWQIWSGVREIPFKTKEALLGSPDQPKKTLRFMLQVAFPNPPQFASKSFNAEEYIDSKPWEFTHYEKEILNTIEVAAEHNKRVRQVLDSCSDFTALQRYFRAILDGKLDGVSIETVEEWIVNLEKQAPKFKRTLRWNARPLGLLKEMIAHINNYKNNSEDLKKYLADLKKSIFMHPALDTNKLKSLLNNKTKTDPKQWKQDWELYWDKRFTEEDLWMKKRLNIHEKFLKDYPSEGKKILLISHLFDALELRMAYKVDLDYKLNLEESNF